MAKADMPSLAHAPWLRDPRLQTIMRALVAEGDTRVVGGAVRNALLGQPVADVDLATVLLPATVMRIGKDAGFGVHPTGLEHGTITLSHEGAVFEVTTLRRDVATDGRRAVVAFTTDWAEDAARRDFTVNAMYCDWQGKCFDFTGGYADLLKRKVKFVGAARTRIREDALRILRFFRFHASYGKSTPDAAGLAACTALRTSLKKLSAERVRQELFKLLAAPRAVETLKIMARHNILRQIIPHTEEWGVVSKLPADPVLRLFVLAKHPDGLKAGLRLSNADAQRLDQLMAAPALTPALHDTERRRMLYHLGVSAWHDAVHLSRARARSKAGWQTLLDLGESWQVPVFPLRGSDLLGAGLAPGPRVGQVLAALEDWWVASDFKPGKQDLLARLGRYRDDT
jgi:poly(A) polymerase